MNQESSGKSSGDDGLCAEEPMGRLASGAVLPMESLFGRPVPWWKRLMDVTISGVALLCLLPLFALIAIYIKLVSKGPVFLGQQRVGYLGREFRLWKFRSMHHNVDPTVHQKYMAQLIREHGADGDVPMLKMENDPRIIPFGTVFRKSSLDELPQLFNVLVGEMTLVGPRPAMPYEVAEYCRWHRGRFDTVPGMTGLWQVSGKNRLTFKQMVRLDIRYVRRRSLWLDLWILLKTVPVILQQIQGNAEPVRPVGEGKHA